MQFLQRYFSLFFLTYLVVLATKIVFVIYLYENFSEYSSGSLIAAILSGYKFDFATSSFMALLGTFFDFHRRSFATVGALLISGVFLVQISDIFYFNESSRHIGYEIFDVLVDAKSLLMTAISHYGVLSFIALVVAFGLFVVLYRYLVSFHAEKLDKTYLFKKLFLIALSIFFIRGMMQHIPLNPWQSNQIGDAKLASLVLNGTYNVVFSLASYSKKIKMAKIPHGDAESIKNSFLWLYDDANSSATSLPLIKTKPNVVLFFLESWSAARMRPYGFGYETTPNFDAILKQSLRPPVMIASGHRTTEGIFAVCTSWQNPLGKSVAKTNLQDNHYTSIVQILSNLGYSNAFFQGTSKETSGTGSLAQQMGFHKSYGKRDVAKRIYEENYWGVHDVDLYNFALDKLENSLKEPFVIGINGATTHDNKVPSGVQKISFTGTKLDGELNALHFADFALGEFMKQMQKRYPNTIYVLFADHCGGGLGGTMQNYQIPFAIHAPNYLKPKELPQILSQRDIAPSLYDLIVGDYKKEKLPFSGKSIFSDQHFFADYYHNGVLGWIEEDNIVEINLQTKRYKCFKMQNLQKIETTCNGHNLQRKKDALNFTYKSQKLLFEDNIQEMKQLRYEK